MEHKRTRRFGKRSAASSVTVILIALLAALSTSSAGAVGTLDQSQETQTDTNFGVGPFYIASIGAQTFTAGITGDLDQIDLRLIRTPSAEPDPLTVELQGVSGGEPTGEVLATAVVQYEAVSEAPDYSWVAIPIGPVAVTQGTQYAIVLHGGDPPFMTARYFASGGISDPYPGGSHMSRLRDDSGWYMAEGCCDLNFRTYVTPPPPPEPQCKLIRVSIGLLGPPIVICI